MIENVVQIKSYAFAIKIVNICKFLQTEKKEYILSTQYVTTRTTL